MNAGATTNRVYDAIKYGILSRAHRPGDRLDPALLATDLASSVTPVRDALYLLVGEGLVSTRIGDGFHLPQLTEPELRDRYAWHADVVLLALRDREAPAQRMSAKRIGDPSDRSMAATAIFAGIGAASRNGEHRLAIAALGDRLSAARRVEPVVLDGLNEECRGLEEAWRNDEPVALRRLIIRYHRRRTGAAAEIVRALYRADLS